ncbi:hypothetical protein LOTGIDRAFT_230986 [Lottia gigantea]|uniref:Uncharacterized protein n=1 Tax=Lottia gigantea TaxID=225164 RepID=V4CDN6_LOTGI|nr:hypothetical protein LOTGIDRAFT_230986 [Lottia gigantea]ESP00045.1 hypothetical protein LOTGIDRAFT_230986 [Lottia gigantea]
MATNKDIEANRLEPSSPAPPYSSEPQPGATAIPHQDVELPTYQQALHDPTGPPPSYDSLFGRVKEAKAKSSGVLDFLMKVLETLVSTLCFTILLGIIFAIPIAMICMGSIHLEDCPRERFIPIYLIVAGAFGAFRNLVSFVPRLCKSDDEEETPPEAKKKGQKSFHLIDCFLFGWFIAGNVWIYRVYNDFNATDPTSSYYCEPTLYYFAFWLTTATYILIGSMCFCICCGSCLAFCFS